MSHLLDAVACLHRSQFLPIFIANTFQFIIARVRGGIQKKKLVFFGVFPNEGGPPPPPLFLDGLIFSVNRNFGSGRTPPLRDEINPKKFQSFSVNRNFGLGQTPPSPFRINSEIKKYFFMSKKKYFEKLKKKTEYLMKKQSI